MSRLGKFLGTRTVGLIVRTFAKNESDVTNRLELTTKLVNKAIAMKFAGRPVFKRVDILVFSNLEYEERDCGLLADQLRQVGLPRTTVREVVKGDLFCGALMQGVALQLRGGVDFSFIWSPDAESQFADENVFRMLDCMVQNCVAAGLALPELGDAPWQGRIANTAIVWDNVRLISVGGFDLIAAKQCNADKQVYVVGANGGVYPRAGVEEVIALARCKANGWFIGVVSPYDPAARYKEPTDPELLVRHWTKVNTKRIRQNLILAAAGFAEDALSGVVRIEMR